MNFIKYLLLLTICIITFTACSKKVELKGDVFIVTQGAQNYKMGLVQITAIPEAIIKPFIESKSNKDELSANYDKSSQTLKEAELYLNTLESKYKNPMGLPIEEMNRASADLSEARFRVAKAKQGLDEALIAGTSSAPEKYFGSLPPGVATALTDADGKFTLKLPKTGKYALAARAERKIFGKTEEYYWLISVNADSESKSIILSNNNLTNTDSTESLIKTSNYE